MGVGRDVPTVIALHHPAAGGPTLRTPGVEPGSQAWEACMMPLHYVRWCQGSELTIEEYMRP